MLPVTLLLVLAQASPAPRWEVVTTAPNQLFVTSQKSEFAIALGDLAREDNPARSKALIAEAGGRAVSTLQQLVPVAQVLTDVDAVLRQSARAPGSTMSLGAFRLGSKQLHAAWAGGLSVLRWRGGAVARLGLPHSLVEDLIAKRGLAPADAEQLRIEGKHRNVIVRALGTAQPVVPQSQSFDVGPGDRFVIADLDVVTTVSLEQLSDALGSNSPAEAAERLKAQVFARAPTARLMFVVLFIP